jgi:hypothetical protein
MVLRSLGETKERRGIDVLAVDSLCKGNMFEHRSNKQRK